MTQERLMDTAFKASFCDFSNKMLRENEWYKWHKEQVELVNNGADRSLMEKIVPQEWAFDEFVFSYTTKLQIQTDYINKVNQTKSTLTEDKTASVWAYVCMSGEQSSYLSSSRDLVGDSYKAASSVYMSLFIHYEKEKHPYHWDGWLLAEDDTIYHGPSGVLHFEVGPSLFTKAYWELDSPTLRNCTKNIRA